MSQPEMLECLEQETIASFLVGGLGPAELRRMDAHLAVCNRCLEIIAAAARAGLACSSVRASRSDAERLTSASAAAMADASEVLPTSLLQLLDWLHRSDTPLGREASLALHERLLQEATPNRFSLEELLGRGGMGSVYRGFDRLLEHSVALKVLHGMSGEDRLRLKAEFRALADIRHPNLITYYELVVCDAVSFMSMELVRGLDFVQYQRGGAAHPGGTGAAISIPRLRELSLQLASALDCVHAAGKLHRDVKPSNILVTDTGRVVLLDFGLIWHFDRTRNEVGTEAAGTPQYMAPEQLAGQELTPAVDWYAFGLTLRQAITGEAPGPRARRATELSLRQQGHDLPEDLDALLCRLLAVTPGARPHSDEILRCLGGQRVAATIGRVVATKPHGLLIGRDAELAELGRAFGATSQGALRVVEVSGPSGIGKSHLIRHFLSELRERARVLVLTSRCHPREAVPFNAVDGWIDELARELPQQQELLQMAPEASAALVKVFPVLGRWFRIDDPGKHPTAPPGQDVRSRAFSALKALLLQLARTARLVLWVDDIQWGDRDSGVLLRELMRELGPSGVRCPLPALVILSFREEDREQSACLKEMANEPVAESAAARVEVRLGPLDPAASTGLLEYLLEAAPREHQLLLPRLIHEAGGYPFLLSELAHWVSAARPGLSGADAKSLNQVLHARIDDLPAGARVLLQVLSVAGQPLEQSVALRAAGLAPSDRSLIGDLEGSSLLRTTSLADRCSEVYHHRIREQVLERLSEPERSGYHRAIGEALLATFAPNPLAAVEHFEAAGDVAAVKRYILVAASHASGALAFDRAARLYARAIELLDPGAARHELQTQLGWALANAGRGKEAAEAFLTAAQAIETEVPVGGGSAVYLKQKAAEQFMQSGYYQRGMQALLEVLERLGIAPPRSRQQTLLRASAWRIFSLCRGVSLPPSRAPAPSALDLERFDALWAATVRIGLIDVALPSYFATCCLRRALALRDSARLTRALSMEATYSAAVPLPAFRRRAERLLELAAQLGTTEQSAHERAVWLASRGVLSFYQGDCRPLVEDMDSALAALSSAPRELQWTYLSWKIWALVGLLMLGEVRTLVQRLKALEEDARRRDDRFTIQLSGMRLATFAWLVIDRPDQARQEADRGLAWAPAHYTLQHHMHFMCSVDIELYRGNAFGAWQTVVQTWPTHQRNLSLSVNFVRDVLHLKRAQAALGALAALQTSQLLEAPGGYAASRLERVVSQAALTLEKHGLEPGRGWALLLRALLARRAHANDRAAAYSRDALCVFDRASLGLYREAARFCLGKVLGGEQGATLMAEAERWMRDQTISNPAGMLRVLAPGLGA